MSLYGNSRPASGCEHHMSHYWEMMFEQRHERPVPHGTQVSVGTVLVLKLVEALLVATGIALGTGVALSLGRALMGVIA